MQDKISGGDKIAGKHLLIAIIIASFVLPMNGLAIVGPPPSSVLGEAVDNQQLTWSTGGDAYWNRVTSIYYYGGDSAESGDIGSNEETWIKTTVTGPGTLKFYWRVSSEVNVGYLRFYIDGAKMAEITGNINWHQKTFSIGSGSHQLVWKYVKTSSSGGGGGGPVDPLAADSDGSQEISTTANDSNTAPLGSGGGNLILDRGWLDKVEWIPATNDPPSTPSRPSGETNGCTGVTYTYSTYATDPNGDSIKYGWDWNGDGVVDYWTGYYASGSTCHASHAWNSAGTYYVRVKARDSRGAESGWSQALVVTITANSPPAANFWYSPSDPTTEDVIQFHDSSSDPDGDSLTYHWDFGDGTTSSERNPTHQYAEPGTYTVTLTVTDEHGASSSKSKSVVVAKVLKVAIYNVSEMEPAYNDKIGSENWTYTGTYGMLAAIDGKSFTDNGIKYVFKARIVEFEDIAVDHVLTNNGYVLFLAPGDDDYFDDQYDHPLLDDDFKNEIRTFVENGGGYIGTCGGAAFACLGYKYKETGEDVYPPSDGIGSLCLGIVNAYACTSPPNPYNYRYGNRNYFYRGILYDEGYGDGKGRSDWGGIPMINSFTNPVEPFEGLTSVTMRYWGGPWFDGLGEGVIGVAKFGKEPGDEPSTQLHYISVTGEVKNVTTDILDKWSIIEATYGEGRIVLFSCHPEHLTWDWEAGQVIEDLNNYTYIYYYNKSGVPPPPNGEIPPWKQIDPPYDDSARELIFRAAKWAVENIINPNSPPNQPDNPSPADGETNVNVDVTLTWQCTDPDNDALTYDVYFGTTTNPPLVASGLTIPRYNPGTLNYGTTYYWRVVAKDGRGAVTMGSLWQFTTQSEPNIPSPPKPPGGGNLQ